MRKRLAIAGLIAALSFTLFSSYEIKRPCLEKPWGAPQMLEYRNLCYNDVQALYGVRKLNQRVFPYVEEKSYEYPVLMGMTMWATSLAARDHVEYFNANVPVLALMAFLALAGLIGAMGARRELVWFAIGTPILFYAYLNWDLLPVAFVCLAMWAWSRRMVAATGAAIGLGIAAKIYPGFLFPSLLIALWGDRKNMFRLAGGVAGAWLVVNLPIVLAEFVKTGAIEGWLSVFSFHAKRSADFGTVWYWLYRFSSDEFPAYLAVLPAFVLGAAAVWMASRKENGSDRFFLAGASGVLAVVLAAVTNSIHGGISPDDFRSLVDHGSELIFGAGAIGFWFAQWKRGHSPWVTGAGVLALYLAVSKIHSPQHALWILPLMIAVEASPSTLIGYLIADATIFVGGFTWIATSPGMQFNAWEAVFVIGVFLRAAFLLRFAAQCALGARDRLIAGWDAPTGKQEHLKVSKAA